MTQPIIGITTYGRNERDLANQYYSEFFFVPADYVDAVRRAGGVPMLLPPGETNWQRWLDVTDGIIVTGGSDIHPARYGGNAEHPNLTIHDLQRDETEIALVQELVTDVHKPTLYICLGAQVLNVALGGTLHEHVPDVVGEDIHRSPEGFWANQPLRAEPGSQLAQVMGATEVTTTSGHHQAIKEVAVGLKVVAEAADGIIEALQVSEHPWALAVQWHPEKTAAFDPTQQALFDQLVQAARQQQIAKRRQNVRVAHPAQMRQILLNRMRHC